ncbi:hypothetical protein OBBRIDRAFT_833607 [Obba rivulosa]|uniref:Uncharacterized protein n=1 Tax=Obba rivulosa TaxID=1052685 RepID=A0A8E2AXC2_9APHY|nr:hypothetical protein OBBRIDRAFT_833607 [Obba rivulosa]
METLPIQISPVAVRLQSKELHIRPLTGQEKAPALPERAQTTILIATRVQTQHNESPVMPSSTMFRLPRFTTPSYRTTLTHPDNMIVRIIRISGVQRDAFNVFGWEMRFPNAGLFVDCTNQTARVVTATSGGTWSLTLRTSQPWALHDVTDPPDLYAPTFHWQTDQPHSLAFETVTSTHSASSKQTACPDSLPATVHLSINQPPVPDVPLAERSNALVSGTLRAYAHLFKIVTPIDVGHFEHYLLRHPNPEFVRSICRSLREGFWPWACTRQEGFPDTWDESLSGSRDQGRAHFIREERDTEIASGRFSKAFPELLPGMFCMPVYAVPKSEEGKFRLITDQSHGPFAVNQMISDEAVIDTIALDGLPVLFHALREYRRTHPDERLVLWKSDVSKAYRRLPMSPYWQLKQVVKIDSAYHVDRCNNFGSRASMAIWLLFWSLVMWIAVEVKGIDHLNYVDDAYGFEVEEERLFYVPYGVSLPAKQMRLLHLWDELGVPHEHKKQLHGSSLPVLGINVDPNAMTATLTPEHMEELLAKLSSFCDRADWEEGRTLLQCQKLIGFVNWTLQVFPLLTPALCNLNAQIAGKDKPNERIILDARVLEDLTWMLQRVRNIKDHRFGFDEWGPADLPYADNTCQIVFVDACLSGIGIYFPWLHVGYLCDVPASRNERPISYWEAMAVCSAVHLAATLLGKQQRGVRRRLGIFCDNTNAVNLFKSFRAQPEYNAILKSSVDVMIAHDIEVRVAHIPGKENVVADWLSRTNFAVAQCLDPELRAFSFPLPQDALEDL